MYLLHTSPQSSECGQTTGRGTRRRQNARCAGYFGHIYWLFCAYTALYTLLHTLHTVLNTSLHTGASDWEDADSRMALLRTMCQKPSSPSAYQQFFKSWRDKMADLFLFRERARLRLIAKQGKQQGDIVAGLDFLNYMEVLVPKVIH